LLPILTGAPKSKRSRSQERSGKSECIVGGTWQIPVSAATGTPLEEWREIWQGEPAKQNEDERRARLGGPCRQAQQCQVVAG